MAVLLKTELSRLHYSDGEKEELRLFDVLFLQWFGVVFICGLFEHAVSIVGVEDPVEVQGVGVGVGAGDVVATRVLRELK